MRRIVVVPLVAVLMALGAGTAFAASNPSGSGQPNQTCLSSTAPMEPGGSGSASGSAFNEVDGIAGGVYAGSGVSATTANSPMAVSQYDVACYQVSQ
jgi:hypothetical protein